MESRKDIPRSNHWIDAWHVNPSVNRNYDFIDGLRGVAIIMVLICHLLYVNPQSSKSVLEVGALFEACGHGVVLFFALSGFLISWPFWKQKFSRGQRTVPPGYGWRRFWKIYPPLAFSLLVLTPCYVLTGHDSLYWATAGKWLAGLAFIIPVDGRLNPVMWTLVVEVQFYIVLPLLFVGIKKASAIFALWVIPSILLVIPVSFRILTGLSPTNFPEINSHFPAAMDAFAFGVLIAGVENGRFVKKSWVNFATLGLILWPLSLVVNAWTATHLDGASYLAVQCADWMQKIGAGCLLLYVANPQSLVARALCVPWLRWCGIISYEWYLFHQPVVLWARFYFGPAAGNPAKYLAVVGGSFLVSLALALSVYRWFSLPILRYGRSIASSERN